MMKGILFTALFSLMTLVATAAPRIILEDNQTHYQQTAKGYILQFKLVATQSEYTTMMDQVAGLADRLTMQTTEDTDGTFNCVFTVNHQNHPEYVHKMLVSIGVAELEYKGNIQSVDTIIDILKSYL